MGKKETEILRSLQELSQEVTDLKASNQELSNRLLSALERLDSSANTERNVGHELGRQREILRLLYDDESRTRAKLFELRSSTTYSECFTIRDPLVSVIIPTFDKPELLVERAIASVQRQTHQNFEILVTGDCADSKVADAIASIDDDRISYSNLSVRGPYPLDVTDFWYTAGIPPWNEALSRVRGQWIAPLNDDDAFRPDHFEKLLAKARDERLEFCYGKYVTHTPDSEIVDGPFPPAFHHFALQGALYHSGLRFLEAQSGSYLFDCPGDWSVVRRMMHIGVRIGAIEDVVVDYFPSRV